MASSVKASSSSPNTNLSLPKILQLPSSKSQAASYVDRYKTFRLQSLLLAPEAFASTYARESAFSESKWLERLTNPSAAVFVVIDPDATDDKEQQIDSATGDEEDKLEQEDTGSRGSSKDKFECDDSEIIQGRFVSSVAILGPLPYGPAELSIIGNPWNSLQADESSSTDQQRVEETFGGQGEAKRPHFRVNAVFTHPDFRQRGLSKALFARAVEHAERLCANSVVNGGAGPDRGQSDVDISVVVDGYNTAAKNLYTSIGFEVIKEVEMKADMAIALERDGKEKERVLLMLYRPRSK